MVTLLLATLLACESPPPPDDGVMSRDSAGLRIVESRAPDRPLNWEFEVARLGGADSGPLSHSSGSTEKA